MGTLIKVEDIHKIYNPGENEVRALDGISLEIRRGEFAAIVGHSGSGKSTLMNMLGCLDSPTSGRYYLDGKDVSQLSDNELSDIRNQKIGFIFQGFNLIPNLDAVGNVELPLIYRGISRQLRKRTAVQALERVGLGKRLRHKPGELSGGQQQRVAVARAIAAQPSVILADEPTGNLDHDTAREIMMLLDEINRGGTTVLVITHSQELVKEMGKRVITMDRGSMIGDTALQWSALRRGERRRRNEN